MPLLYDVLINIIHVCNKYNNDNVQFIFCVCNEYQHDISVHYYTFASIEWAVCSLL